MMPMMYSILGISTDFLIIIIPVILGIILVKNRNILNPNKAKIILFLFLFILFSCLPVLWVPFIHDFSLLDVLKREIFGYRGFDSSAANLYRHCSLICIPFLLIISYLLSCISVTIYKSKTKK